MQRKYNKNKQNIPVRITTVFLTAAFKTPTLAV